MIRKRQMEEPPTIVVRVGMALPTVSYGAEKWKPKGHLEPGSCLTAPSLKQNP